MMEVDEQQNLIAQLKDLVRERDEALQAKDKELQETNSKLSKMRLQSKAKVAKMTSQLEEAKKGITDSMTKSTESLSEDTPSSSGDHASRDTPVSSGDHASRGKALMMRKKLEEKEKMLHEKDDTIAEKVKQLAVKDKIITDGEDMVKTLNTHVQERDKIIGDLQDGRGSSRDGESEGSMREMYAQMVYKDRKIIELNNHILEQEKSVMDLQEFIGEKNEVIRGRDKVFEVLQSTIKEHDQNIHGLNALVAKLTAKVEASEENISTLSESLQKKERELKTESERFDAKLRETQKYFEETIEEREGELRLLKDMIHNKEHEISVKDNDLREIISRHQQDIEKIMSKGEVDIQDHILQMLEQKLKDTNEILEGKMKVIEILQTELSDKTKKMEESNATTKSFMEKLQMTSEQMIMMQENFVDMETQWREERLKLEKKAQDVIEKHERELSEKDGTLQTLQAGLAQYEAAYQQAAAQYNVLQERYQQAYVEVERLRQGSTTVASQDTPQQASSQDGAVQLQEKQDHIENLQRELTEATTTIESLKSSLSNRILEAEFDLQVNEQKAKIDDLEKELKFKDQEISVLKKTKEESASAASSGAGGKGDTKMLKVKAQLTAKVKALQNEIKELKKGGGEREELSSLKNQLVELEDEKGSLQLKLVDFDDMKPQLETLEDQIKTMEGEKKAIEEEKCAFMADLKKAEEDKERLTADIADMQTTFEQTHQLQSTEHQQITDELRQRLEDTQTFGTKIQEERDQEKRQRVQFEMRLVEYEDYKKHAEADIIEMMDKINSLSEQTEILEQTIGDKDLETTKVEGEKYTLEVHMAELEEEREGLEKDKKSLLSEIENLNEKIEYEMQPNIAFETENDALQSQISNLDEKLKSQRQITKEQKQQINELSSLKTQLKADKLSLEQQLTAAQDKLEADKQTQLELNSEIQLLEQELLRTQNELEADKQTLQELKSDIGSLEKTHLTTCQELSTEKQTVNELRTDKQTLDEQHQKAQEELMVTKQTVQELESNNQSQVEDLQTAGNELVNLVSTKQQLEVDKQSVGEQLEQALDEINKLTNNIQNLQEHGERALEEFKGEKAGLVKEMTAKQESFQKLLSDSEELSKEKEALISEKKIIAVESEQILMKNDESIQKLKADLDNEATNKGKYDDECEILREKLNSATTELSMLDQIGNTKQEELREMINAFKEQEALINNIKDENKLLLEKVEVFTADLISKEEMITNKEEIITKKEIEFQQTLNSVDEHKTMNNQLQGNNEKLKEKMQNLLENLKEMEDIEESRQDEINTLSTSLQEVTTAKERLDEENRKYGEKIQAMSQQIAEMEEVGRSSQQEIQQLSNLKEENAVSISNLQQHLDILATERENISKAQESSAGESVMLRTDIETLEASLDQKEQALVAASAKLVARDAEIVSLSQMFLKHDGNLDDIRSFVDAKLLENQKLINFNRNLKQSLDTQIENLNAAEKSIETLAMDHQDIIMEHNSSLQAMEIDIQNLKETVSEKEQSVYQLHETVELRDTAINDLQSALSEKDASLSTVHAQVNNTQETIEGLKSALTDKEESHSKIADQLSEAQQESAALSEHHAKEESLHQDKVESILAQIAEKENLIMDLNKGLAENSEHVLKTQSELDAKTKLYEELEVLLRSSEESITTLQSSLLKKEDELSSLDLRLSQANREIEVLREGESEKGQEFHTRSQNLLQQVSEKENDILNLNRQLMESNDICKQLQIDVQVNSETVVQLENLNSEKDEAISLIHENLSENEGLLSNAKKQIQGLTDQQAEVHQQFETRVEALEQQKLGQESQAAERRKEFNEKQTLCHDLEIKLEHQNKANSQLKEFSLKLKEKVKSLNKELNDTKGMHSKLEEDKITLREENQKLHVDLSAVRTDIDRVQMQSSAATSNYKSIIENYEQKLISFEETEKELEKVKFDLQTKSEVYDELEQFTEKLKEKIKILKTDLHNSNIELNKTIDGITELKNIKVSLENELSAKRTDNETLKSQSAEVISNLHDKIQNQEETENVLKKQLQELSSTAADLQNDLSSKEAEIRSLNDVCERFKTQSLQEVKALQEKNDDLFHSLKLTEKELCESSNLVETLKSETLTKDSDITRLSELVKQLELESTEKDSSACDLEVKLSNLKMLSEEKEVSTSAAQRDYEHTVELLRSTLSARDASIIQLTNKCEKCSVTLDSCTHDLQRKLDEITIIQNNNESLVSELATLQTSYFEKDQELEILHKKIDSMTRDKEMKVKSLLENVEELSTQAQQSADEIESLNSQLHTAENSVAESHTTIDDLVSKLKNIVAEVDTNKLQCSSLESHVVSLQAEVQDLKQQTGKLQAYLSDRETKVSDLLQGKAADTAALDLIQSKFDQLSIEKHDCDKQNLDFQKIIEEKIKHKQILSDELQIVKSELRSLHEKMANDGQKHIDEVTKLSSDVQIELAAKESLHQDLVLVSKELDECKQCLINNDSELLSSAGDVDQLQAKMQTLIKQNEDQSQHASKMNISLEEKEEKVNALSNSLKELVIDNEAISQTLEESKQEIKCLSNQISALSMENDLLSKSKEELEMCSLNKDNDIVALSNVKQELVANIQQYEKKVNELGCELQLKQTDNANAESLIESNERDLQALRGTCEEHRRRNIDLEENFSLLQCELENFKLVATKLLKSEEEKITEIESLETNLQGLIRENETECNAHKVTKTHIEEAQANIESLTAEIIKANNFFDQSKKDADNEMKKIMSEHDNKVISLMENLNIQSQQIETFEKEIADGQEDSKQKADMVAAEKDKYVSGIKQVNIIVEEKDAKLNALMENLVLLSQKLNESDILCNSNETEIDHLKHQLQQKESELAEVNNKVCKLDEELQTLNQQKDEQIHLIKQRDDDLMARELMRNTLQKSLSHSEENYNHIQSEMADVTGAKDKIISDLESRLTDKTECLLNESKSSQDAAKRAEHEISELREEYQVISEKCEKLKAMCIEKDSSHSTIQRHFDFMLSSFQELENNHAAIKLEKSSIEETALFAKQELDQLKDVMKVLLEERKAMECHLEEKADLVKSLSHVTEALDETVVQLQETLKERESDLQDYVTQLMEAKQHMEKVCSERDQYVSDCKKLTVNIEEKDAKLDALTGHLVSLSENLKESEALCKSKQNEIESFRHNLIEKEGEAQQDQYEICNLKQDVQVHMQQIDGHIINIKQKDEDLLAAEGKTNDVRMMLQNSEEKYKVVQTEMANALVEKDKVISILEITLSDKTECLLKETESSHESTKRKELEISQAREENLVISDQNAQLEALCMTKDSINSTIQNEYDSLKISFQELKVNFESVQFEKSSIEEAASLAKYELSQLKEVLKSVHEEQKIVEDQLEEKTDLVKSLNHVTETLDETIVKSQETLKERENEMKKLVNQLMEANQQMEGVLSEKHTFAIDLKHANISREEKDVKLDALMENLDVLSENLKESKMMCATKESQVDSLTNQVQEKESHLEQRHDENSNIKLQLQTLQQQKDEQSDIIKQREEDLLETVTKLNEVQNVLADTEEKYNVLQLEMNYGINNRDKVISDLEMSLADKTESLAKEFQSSQETAIRTEEAVTKVKAENRDILDHSTSLEVLCSEKDSINATLQKEYDSLQISCQELQVNLESVQLQKSSMEKTASLAKDEFRQLKEIMKSFHEEKKAIEEQLEEKTNLVKSLNHVTETLDETIVKSHETLKHREDEMKELVDQLIESKQKMEGVLSEKEKYASALKQANILLEEKNAKLDSLIGNLDMLSENLKESDMFCTGKQSEIDSLTNQLQEKESHLEQIHDENSNIKQQLQTLQQQNDEHSSFIKQREEDFLETDAKVNEVQNALADIEEKYNILQLEMNEGVNSRDKVIFNLEMSVADKTESLAKEFQSSQETAIRTEEAVTKVKAENRDILDHSTSLEVLCSEKDSINATLQKEYDSLKISFQELQVNLESVQLQKTSVEETASFAKDELTQLKEVMKSLLEEKKSIEEQLEEKTDLVKSLNHVTEILDETIVKSQESLKQREDEMKELVDQLMKSKQKIERVLSEKENYASDLKQANILLEEKNAKLDAFMENLDMISENLKESDMLCTAKQSEIDSLRNQLQEKESHLEQLCGENSSIKDQLQTRQKQNDEQRDIINQSEIDLLATDARVNEVQKALADSEEKYKQLELEMKEGVNNRDKIIYDLELSLTDKTESLAKEYQSSQEIAMRTGDEMAKVKSENCDILDHSENLEAMCSQKDTINITLQKEYDSLQVSFHELQVNLESVQLENSSIEETASSAKDELGQLKEMMKSLLEGKKAIEEQLEEKTDLVKSLNHVTETLDETIVKSQESLKQREDKMKELVDQLIKSKQKIERVLSEKENYASDLKQANILLEEKNAKLDALMEHLDMISENLKESDMLCTAKQSEIDSLRNQLQEKESHLEQLCGENSNIKDQLQTRQKQNDEQRDIINQSEIDLLATDARVNEVQKSLAYSEEKYKQLELEMNEGVNNRDKIIYDLEMSLTDKTESLAKEYQSSQEIAMRTEDEMAKVKSEYCDILDHSANLEALCRQKDTINTILQKEYDSLQVSFQELQVNLESVQLEKSSIEETASSTKDELSQLKEIMKSLLEEKKATEERLEEKTDLVKSLNHVTETLDETIVKYQETLNNREDEMKELVDHLMQSKQQMDGVLSEKEKYASDLKQANILLEEKKAKLDALVENLDVLSENLKESCMLCTTKQSEIDSLMNQVQEKESHLEQLHGKNSNIKDQLQTLQKQNDEQRGIVKQREEDLFTTDAKVNEVQKTITDSDEKYKLLQLELYETVDNKDKIIFNLEMCLTDKTDSLEKQCQSRLEAENIAENEIEQMKEEKNSISEEMIISKLKLEEMVAENDKLESSVKQLNITLNEYDAKLEALMGNLDVLSVNLNESESLFNNQKNEITAIRNTLAERDSELEHAVCELKNLQQELQRSEQENNEIIKQRDEVILAAETNMAGIHKILANTENKYKVSQDEIIEKNRVISELEVSLQETSDCFTKEHLSGEKAVMIAKQELEKVQVENKVVTDKVAQLEAICIERESIQVTLQTSLLRSESYQENAKLEDISLREESQRHKEERDELQTAMKSLEVEKGSILKQLAEKTDLLQHVSEMSEDTHIKAQESMTQMKEELKSLEEKQLEFETKMREVVTQKETCLQETRHLNVITEEKGIKLQVLAESIELLTSQCSESDKLRQSLHEENEKLQEGKSIFETKVIELQNNLKESNMICEETKAQSNVALQNKDAIICDLENCLEADRVEFNIFKNDMFEDLQNKTRSLSKHEEDIKKIEEELLNAHDKMESLGNEFESKISKLYAEKGMLVSDLETARIHVSNLNEQLQEETTKCEIHVSDLQKFKKQVEDLTKINTLHLADICDKNKIIETLSSSVQQLQFEANETELKLTELTHNLEKQEELFHLRECSAADVDTKLLSLLDEAEVHKNKLHECNIQIDAMERKIQCLENRLQEMNDEQAETSKRFNKQQQSIEELERRLYNTEKHADMLLKTLNTTDNSLQKLQINIEKLENENNSLLNEKELLNSSISDKELVILDFVKNSEAKFLSKDNIIDDQRVEISNLQSAYVDFQMMVQEKELSFTSFKQECKKHESEQNESLEKYQQLLSEQEESAKLVNIELCALQEDQAASKTIVQELRQKLDHQNEITRNMESAASENEQHRTSLLDQNGLMSKEVSVLQINKDEMIKTCEETKEEHQHINELLVEKDAKIISLDDSLNSTHQRLTELETMLKDKIEHIQEMEDNIQELEMKNSQHVERLQALHSECEEKDIDLERLNQTLAETKNALQISVFDNTSLHERLLNESENLQRNAADKERISSDWKHSVDTKEQELCEIKLELETCQKLLKTYKLKVEESVCRLDLKDSQLISMNEMAMQANTELKQSQMQVDRLQTVISKGADTVELHQQDMKEQQEKMQLLMDALQNLQNQNQNLLEKHDILMKKDEDQTNLALDLQKQLSENEVTLNANVRKLEARELQCKKAIAAMKKFKFDLQESIKETNRLKNELEQGKQHVEELQLLLNKQANKSEEFVHELQSVRDATSDADNDRAEDDSESVPTVNILQLEIESLKGQLDGLQECWKTEAKRNEDLQNDVDNLTERLEWKQSGDSENEKELLAQIQTYGEYCQQLQDQVELLAEQLHESTKVTDQNRSEEGKRNAEIQELMMSLEQQTEKCSTLGSKLKKRDSEIQELENLLEQESGYEIQVKELEAGLARSDELCQSQIQLIQQKEIELQELLVIRSDLDVKIDDMKSVEEQLQQEINMLQSQLTQIGEKHVTQQADLENLQQMVQQLLEENEELQTKVMQEQIVRNVSTQEEASSWDDIALPEVNTMLSSLSNVDGDDDTNIIANGKELPVEKISENFDTKVFAERENSLTANPETLSKTELNDYSEPNISELPSEIDRQASVIYAIDGANDSNVPSLDFEITNAFVDENPTERLEIQKTSTEQPDEIAGIEGTIRSQEVSLQESKDEIKSLLEKVEILELRIQEREAVYEDHKLQLDMVASQLSVLQNENETIALDMDNLQQSQTEVQELTKNLEANVKQRDDIAISLNQISDERNKLRQALEESLSEISSFNVAIDENSVALSDTNSQLNSMSRINEVESFKLEMESLRNEKNSLTEEIEELQSALKELENRNEFLGSNLEDRNLQITMLEEKHVLKDHIIEQRSQEVISMQTNYEELCSSLETKYNESTSKIFKLETQLIESEEVNSCLRTQHDSVKMIYEQLTVDNAALQEQLKNMSSVQSRPPNESIDQEREQQQISFDEKMNEIIVHEPLRQAANQNASGSSNEFDELTISHQSLLDEHEIVRSNLKLTQIKCQKMLIKLKSFKDKNVSLQKEISDLEEHSKITLEDHQFHLAQLKDTCEQLDRQLIEEIKKNGLVNSKYKDEQDLSSSLQNQIHVHIADLQQSESNVEKALKEKETLSAQFNEQKVHYESLLVTVEREHQTSKDKLIQLDVEVKNLAVKSLSEQSIFDIEIERISQAAKEDKLLCERQIHESNEQQKMLLSDNDEYQRMVKELQAANGKLRKEKDRLAAICNDLESSANDTNYAEKVTECEKLIKDIEQLKENLHEAKLETQTLKEDLEHQNITLSEVASTKDAEISDLKIQLQTSKDDLQEKQDQVDCLLSNFNAEKKILQNELDNITQDSADEKINFIRQEKDAKEQYNMMLSDNEEYQHLVKTLQENMKKTKTENDELRFKVKRLESSDNYQSLPDQDKDTSDLEARFKELNSDHDYLLEEMEEMRRELLDGKREKQRLVEQPEEVTKESVGQSKDDKGLNDEQLQTENKALRDKIDGLEWKLDEISGLEEQIEDLNLDLSTQKKMVFDLNIQLNVQQLENNALREEINSLNLQEKSDNLNLSGEKDVLNLAPELSITSDMNSSEYAETIDKLNIENSMLKVQINDLQTRFQDLRQAKDELKDLKDKHNKSAQTNIPNSNAAQNGVEGKVNGNQMEYHSASKDVSEKRILQLEKQCDLLTDENMKLKQQLVILEGEAEICLLESNTLRIQEERKDSSDGDGSNKFHDEYMKLNEMYTALIQEKGRIQLQLNMANHSLVRREGRCQQLATQVSQLTEDRSYLNIQLANLSKALREKEQTLEQLQSQYRALHHSYTSMQSKAIELEQRVVSESVQRSSASPVRSSPSEPPKALEQSSEDKAQVEKLNRTIHHLMQRLQQSEEVQKEIMQRHVAMETTMIRDKDLQLQEAEHQRDEALEQYSQLQQMMLIDQNCQMLLDQSIDDHRGTMPAEYREVHVQMEDEPGSKMIPETSKILTRKGRGYFQRVRRWFWLQKAYSIDVTEI